MACLHLDPAKRPSATDILQFEWFAQMGVVPLQRPEPTIYKAIGQPDSAREGIRKVQSSVYDEPQNQNISRPVARLHKAKTFDSGSRRSRNRIESYNAVDPVNISHNNNDSIDQSNNRSNSRKVIIFLNQA